MLPLFYVFYLYLLRLVCSDLLVLVSICKYFCAAFGIVCQMLLFLSSSSDIRLCTAGLLFRSQSPTSIDEPCSETTEETVECKF